MSIFLKNSPVDLLKTIAKRYKLSVSTKKKELIVEDILQSIKHDKALSTESPLHLMTISQLRNKARELNIDYTSIKLKQDIRLAIIHKMQASNMTSSQETTGSDDAFSFENLMSKTLPYLKALAKKYSIKVSKLSKKQLVTLLMEARATGAPEKTIDIEGDKNLSKRKKNELIVMVQNFGGNSKGKTKEQLVDMIRRHQSGEEVLVSSIDTPLSSPSLSNAPPKEIPVLSIPIDMQKEKELVADRKMTTILIKKILKENRIVIPKGVTKRHDLIHLLTLSTATQQPKKTGTKTSSLRKQSEIIPEKAISNNKAVLGATKGSHKVSKSKEVVALDDVHSPFSPVPVSELLEEPTEKQLQDELYRCLEFYEYPK